MAPTSASDSQRGRRLLAALFSAAALIAVVATLMGGTPARADNPPGPVRTKSPTTSPSNPFLSPTPSALCGGDQGFDFCPSPSPSVVVVSPVAPDPSATPATPSYLVGTLPTPAPTQDGTNTVSSPVPLGGGFVDQLPSPSQQTAAPSSDLAPHQSGLPLPFLAVGALLILGAVGSLIYALAPRQKPVFVPHKPAGQSPVFFTPYGPDSPTTNLLSGGQPPRPGPTKPA